MVVTVGMHTCFETSDVVELSLLCSPNLAVNKHSVSVTYVAYVAFLCHCVRHSMEDSQKKFYLIFLF